MIPILYEKDETLFGSNGLGRLRDCISCIVTEERNGIYECDFEYPVTGAHYDEIQVGRIIGVTHDESGDVQPFDIVSLTRPIDGVVTFHCTHLSYRQCYIVTLPAIGAGHIESLADAIHMITTWTNPENPFTYWTDKTSTGHLGCATGIPYSVRAVLGGVEGSILDAYGGEYEWDKWTVKLWSSRGQARDFTIRYGVNMLDYNEEYDIQGTYSSCQPYWTDGTQIALAPRVLSTGQTVTGREQCVPLDLSDKFEEFPDTGQLQAAARAYMAANNPFIPKQNIHVEFARLQDIGYEGFENLLECNLCDTINVVFPDYNSTGQFKIVKTVWDVLADRYESMELGDLSVTLSEALGVTQGTGTGMPNLDNYVKKSGDTMTGDLAISTSNSTSRVRVTTSATNIVLAAQNGGHHGLWSDTLQKWIVYGLTGGIVKVNETTIPASATLVQMSQQGWGTSLSFNCTKKHAIVLMSSQILLIWLASTNDVNTLLVQNGATPIVKSGVGSVTNGNWTISRSGTNVTITAVSGSATMTAFYV